MLNHLQVILCSCIIDFVIYYAEPIVLSMFVTMSLIAVASLEERTGDVTRQFSDYSVSIFHAYYMKQFYIIYPRYIIPSNIGIMCVHVCINARIIILLKYYYYY